MCDRTAERAFPLRSFNVDMNPLVIARTRRKRVDARLIYRDPIGKTKFLPDPIAQTSEG
jgi:hypothetical protein